MLIKSSTLIFGVGIDSLLLFIIYFLGILIIFRYSKKNRPEDIMGKILEENYSAYSLTQTNIKFIIAGIIIVFTAIELAKVAKSTGRDNRMGNHFYGNYHAGNYNFLAGIGHFDSSNQN